MRELHELTRELDGGTVLRKVGETTGPPIPVGRTRTKLDRPQPKLSCRNLVEFVLDLA